MNIEKVRCPLRGECGAKECKYEHRERWCSYYLGNAREGYELEDQTMGENHEIE